MQGDFKKSFLLGISCAFIIYLFGPNTLFSETPEAAPEAVPSPEASPVDTHLVPASTPSLSEDTFPCSDCHDGTEVNLKQRVLKEEHTKIKLKHNEEHMWCFDCHDPTNRDKLHLASGKLIEFSEAPQLCGQCHGSRMRELQAGIHGKRTGSWNGDKKFYLCASCHSAHAPKFKLLKPLPPPMKPTEIKAK